LVALLWDREEKGVAIEKQTKEIAGLRVKINHCQQTIIELQQEHVATFSGEHLGWSFSPRERWGSVLD